MELKDFSNTALLDAPVPFDIELEQNFLAKARLDSSFLLLYPFALRNLV